MIEVAPAPKPMMRRPKSFVVAVMFVIAVVWSASFVALKRSPDPDMPLFDYRGTSGPYRMERDATGALAPGPLIYAAHPGDVVGWVSTICVYPGVTGLSVMEMVRDVPNTPDDEVVARMEVAVPAPDAVCNGPPDHHDIKPRTISRLIPMDAPVGYYQIKRQMILTVNGHPRPDPIDLPTIHIKIEKP